MYVRENLKIILNNMYSSNLSKCFVDNSITIWSVMAIDARWAIWLHDLYKCNKFTKQKITINTWFWVLKGKSLYCDMAYRYLLYLIKFSLVSIDHVTNCMSYINDFCLCLCKFKINMPFWNRNILCTLNDVNFHVDSWSNKPFWEEEKEEIGNLFLYPK